MSDLMQDHQNNWKVFWKTVSAFFFSHIGGLLIANIFCFGLSSLFEGYGFLIVIPVVLFLYSYPIYSSMWNAGHRDSNSAQFGHTVLHRGRGFLYGIVGSVPIIVISLGFVLSKFGLLFNFVIPYKLLNAEIWPIINVMSSSPFLPDFAVWQILLIALLSVAVPVLIGELGYLAGTYDFAVMQWLIYENNDKKK